MLLIAYFEVVHRPQDFRRGYEYYYFGSSNFLWSDSSTKLRYWHLGLHLYSNDYYGLRIIGNDLDLNDDGLLDVVITNDEWYNKNDYQAYFLNRGNREFEPHSWRYKDDTLTMIDAAHLADIDGNGKLDIVYGIMAPRERTGILIYYDFPWDMNRRNRISFPGSVETPYVADVNNDGYLDILLGVWKDSSEQDPDGMECSTILWGSPEGFSRDNRSFCLYGGGTHVIFVSDFNNDTYLDVFVGSTYYGFQPNYPPRIYWGGPDGLDSTRYSLVWTQPPPEDRMGTYGGTAADMNGDGYLDIVGCWHDVFILWGNARGYSHTNRTLLKNPDCRSLQVEDINKDGYLDIIAASKAPLSDWNNGIITIYLGPDYRNSVVIPSPSAYGVYVADLDNDGYPDIVSSQKELSSSAVIWNNYPSFSSTELPGTNKASRNLSVQIFGNVYDRKNRFGYISPVVSVPYTIGLKNISVFGYVPDGMRYNVFVRSSNDGRNFGPWIPISQYGEPLINVVGSFFQYKIDIYTDLSKTSLFHIDSVKLAFSDEIKEVDEGFAIYNKSVLLYGNGKVNYGLYSENGRLVEKGSFMNFKEVKLNRGLYLLKLNKKTYKFIIP